MSRPFRRSSRVLSLDVESLDVEGSGFEAVGERNRDVGRLQRRYPGLLPVTFWSPYEAAARALISHRSDHAGGQGQVRDVSPAGRGSQTVRSRRARVPSARAPGSPGGVPRPLRPQARVAAGAGSRAMEGRLDASRLRSMSAERVLAELEALPGLGLFSAEPVLLRGAGHPDLLPTRESRLPRAVQRGYRLDHLPGIEELSRPADAWRPYRTWVCLLLRTELEDDTHEIADRRLPRGARG